MAHKKIKKVGELDMRRVQQLQRISKQGLEKHKFHQERAAHIQGLIHKQKAATYEAELARFENARLQGPLGAEARARMDQLKKLLQ